MYWINLICGCFATSIGLLFSFLNLKTSKTKKKNKVVFIFLFLIFISLINIYLSGIQKMMIVIIGMDLISYFFIYDRNLKESTIYSFSVFVISTICEILLSLCIKVIMNFIEFDMSNFFWLFSTINSLFLYLFTKIKFINKSIKKLPVSNKVVYSLMITILLLLTFIIFKNYYIMKNNYDFILNVLTYIFVIITIFILYKNNTKRESIEEKYNQMLEYVTKYEGIINEQGKKNHEYNNQLMILSGYLDDKKYEKVREYLDTIVGEHRTGQNYEIRQLSNFPNGGLKGLMYYKIQKMEELKVKYYLYVSPDIQEEFDKFDVKIYQDITKVFGVFIDNAIEAAKDSNKKEVEIDIRSDDDFITITISNTYLSDEICNVGKTGYSTKGKGHGYGLSLVKDIIRKNEKLETVNDYDKEMYTQTLLIDIKK